MPYRISTLLTVACMLLAGCAPRVDVTAEEDAVRAVSARWLEASTQRDAAGIAGLFAEDGAVYWEDRPPTAGPAAIEDFMRRQFADNPAGEGSFGPDRVDVAASGDLAVELGAYQSPGGAGRYVTVYRKVGSDWKVAADMSVDAAPHGGAPQWAQESLAQWYEAFNAHNAAGLADLYTPDARVGAVRGRAAIMRYFRTDWSEHNTSCSGDYDDFVVVGPVATARGRDVCSVTPSGGGAPTTVYSHWVSVYERQADGRWLCSRDYGEPVGS